MTVFVETHLTELDKQINMLSSILSNTKIEPSDMKEHFYTMGLMHALLWIKYGGEPVWSGLVGDVAVTLNATGPDQHA